MAKVFLGFFLLIALVFPNFREGEAPPLPIVINRYSDEQLRSIVKRMKDRLQIYKDKVADQYASSPEITPPVSECKHNSSIRILHLWLLLGL